MTKPQHTPIATSPNATLANAELEVVRGGSYWFFNPVREPDDEDDTEREKYAPISRLGV